MRSCNPPTKCWTRMTALSRAGPIPHGREIVFGVEHALSVGSLVGWRQRLRRNTGCRSHFRNWIPQTTRHVVVGQLIERYGIHWWWHPREARPFDRRCVNDCACFDQCRSYRPARPRNLVFHCGLPFCCRRRPTNLALSPRQRVARRGPRLNENSGLALREAPGVALPHHAKLAMSLYTTMAFIPEGLRLGRVR